MPGSNTRRMYGGRSRNVGSRRKTEWIATTTALVDIGAGASSLVFSFSQATLAPLYPFTVVRTRIALLTAADAGFISDQDWSAALGVMVTTQLALSAGAASLPNPITNIGDDYWFVHQPFMGFVEASSGVDLLTGLQINIDSKAQRKVEDGQVIVGVIQNLGGDSVQIAIMARLLLKLH